MKRNRPFRGAFFDLDNTLYPKRSGLFPAIDRRITLYLQEKFNLSREEAALWRRRYRAAYHITLRGLMAEHGIQPEEYLEYVHRVPVEDYLSPDPALAALLGTIPIPKYIFTNGSRAHAERVLRRLSVEGHFADIFDIAATGYLPKPEPSAFRFVLGTTGLEPRQALYVDDLRQNLRAAADLGMVTILINEQTEPADGVDYAVRDLGGLAVVLDSLLGPDG